MLRGLDRPLLAATAALLGAGLLALYSAVSSGAEGSSFSLLHRQLTWVGFGILLASALLLLDYHHWLEWAYVLYGVNLLLLALVLEMGVVRGGAQRWLTIGGLTVQPSEFAKVTTILVLARVLGSRPSPGSSHWRTAALSGVILAVPMALILMEPNLGTALVFVPAGLAMLWVWGIRMKILGVLLAVGMALAPLGWWFLADYQRSRLMVFMNPSLDPLGAGYTVIQSRIAVGSGGLIGKGWLSGTQNQLNFLPERHTDFIFSVIGEEWGFLGTSLCLGLFAIFFTRGLLLATQSRDPFGRLLAAGFVTLLATHAAVNTAMTLGMAPVVGLPLPFMSYGGSWMLTCLAAVGILLSIGIRRPGL